MTVALTWQTWQRISAGLLLAAVEFPDEAVSRNLTGVLFDGPPGVKKLMDERLLTFASMVAGAELWVVGSLILADPKGEQEPIFRPLARFKDDDLQLNEQERALLFEQAEELGNVFIVPPDAPPDDAA